MKIFNQAKQKSKQMIIFACMLTVISLSQAQADGDMDIYSSGVTAPSNFLHTNPGFPNWVGTGTLLEVGMGYPLLTNRAILYGGNLGVSQDAGLYGNAGGKWSFKGAWGMYLSSTANIFNNYYTTGRNYLVDYHQWGDYAAHFGLKERESYIEIVAPIEGWQPPPLTANQKIKDATITWSYNVGATPAVTPSRLIFQTIEGVDINTNLTPHIAKEWATILHNGNMGLGTNNPLSHFDITTTGLSNNLAFTVTDTNQNTRFLINEDGKVALNTNNLIADLTISSKDTNNKEALIISDYNDDIKFIVTNDGKVGINRNNAYVELQVDGRAQFKSEAGTDPNFPIFSVNSDSKNNMLLLREDGAIYMPTLTNSTASLPLYVNPDGRLVASNTTAPAFPWLHGGNAITGDTNDLIFGTTTKSNNIFFAVGNDTIVGHDTVAKIYGKGGTRHGFMEFRKPIAMGGYIRHGNNDGYYAVADNYNALNLKSVIGPAASTRYGKNGILQCLSSDSLAILNVGNREVSFFDTSYIFTESTAFITSVLVLEGNTEMYAPLTMNAKIEYTTQGVYDIGSASFYPREINGLLPYNQRSDRRLKKDIEKIDYGLNIVLKLNPVKYKFKKETKGKEYIGFIAQELINVIPEVVDIPTDSTKEFYRVAYSSIIPILTKAIQELNTKDIEQKEDIKKLKTEFQKLSLEMQLIKECCNKTESTVISHSKLSNQNDALSKNAYLLQNIPNPFDATVMIPCYIPEKETNAKIMISNNQGAKVYEKVINQRGNCTIQLDDLNISPDKYFYYLLINNAMVDAKVMLKK